MLYVSFVSLFALMRRHPCAEDVMVPGTGAASRKMASVHRYIVTTVVYVQVQVVERWFNVVSGMRWPALAPS